MRFLLIDRVVRIRANQEITAIKNVALSDDVFTDHFVGAPIMPGSLLIESLAQACTALLEVSCGLKQKALLVMVDRAKFRRLVKPGDQMCISATVNSMDETTARLDGTILVGDQTVLTAVLTFALDSVDKYYPERWRHAVYNMYDIWLADAEMIGVEVPSQELA